jgi:hypothetical protein
LSQPKPSSARSRNSCQVSATDAICLEQVRRQR